LRAAARAPTSAPSAHRRRPTETRTTLKTLARLFLERRGYGHSGSSYGHKPYKPWKKGKKRPYGGYHPGYHNPYDHGGYPPPPPYGYHHRPSVKQMIVEAVLRRLFRR